MSATSNDLDFTNWTAPPEPPPTPVIVAGQPQRRIITSRAGFAEALDEVIAKTKRSLRIFDPTLAEFGMGSAAREEQLRAFLVSSRTNRLMIAVHDTDIPAHKSPRLMRLMRQFGHAIAIHQTHEEIRNLQDVLVIGDDAHCLRRPHASQPRGSIYLDDPIESREWLNRFNAIWEQSNPAVSATTVGL